MVILRQKYTLSSEIKYVGPRVSELKLIFAPPTALSPQTGSLLQRKGVDQLIAASAAFPLLLSQFVAKF